MIALNKTEFSTSITMFLQGMMAHAWMIDLPNTIFIRDYENLPHSSPNDVDILSSKSEIPKLLTLFDSHAKAHDLVFCCKKLESSALMLIFDLNCEANKRHWLLFEIHGHVSFNNATIFPDDIKKEYTSGLPTPTDEWVFLLYFIQGLRKNKLNKKKELLQGLLNTHSNEIRYIAHKFINYTLDDLYSTLQKPDRPNVQSKPRSTLGICDTMRALKPTIMRKIYQRIFFLNYPKIFFFTVHGADGVGKTTTLEHVKTILAQYPFNSLVFHHVQGWKHPKKQIATSENSPPPRKRKYFIHPYFHHILKKIYSVSPQQLKNLWILAFDLFNYSKRINVALINNFYKSSIMMVDRYIYDIHAKYSLRPEFNSVMKRSSYFFCKLLRKPKIAFFLYDSPERIIARKQELSLLEIDSYQKTMAEIIEYLNLKHVDIEVKGKTPVDIARIITTHVLHELDQSAFLYLNPKE